MYHDEEHEGIGRNYEELVRPLLLLGMYSNQGDPTMTRNLTAKKALYLAIAAAGTLGVVKFVGLLMALNTILGS